ncbi:hypothetical protein, partial [Blautia obeum]
MKGNKSILAMIVVTSLSVCLMTGCMNFDNSSKTKTQATKKAESIKLFEDYSKQMNTLDGVYEVKQDLSKKFSKAITKGGLDVINSTPDGSFVVSLGNTGKYTKQSIQSLNYSMSEDYKQGKANLNILCVKEYPEDEKLSKSDKYIKAIYNIFKSLTNSDISRKEFFELAEKAFNENESMEFPYQDIIPIQVVQVKKSRKYIKTIQLSC